MDETMDFEVFRTDRPGIRKVLGDLEAEIMELIWARPHDEGTTVRDIFTVLYARRGLAYTTVMSTMTRLARKRLLRAVKRDQAYLYFPTLTEEQLVSGFVGHILADLIVNFSGVALDQLAALTDPEAERRARQLLDEIARRRATANVTEVRGKTTHAAGEADRQAEIE